MAAAKSGGTYDTLIKLLLIGDSGAGSASRAPGDRGGSRAWSRLTVPARVVSRGLEIVLIGPEMEAWESSVGASLPILSTMKDLLLTGDRVHSIRGCLSGTMAYVLRCHAPGRKTFCDALREAIANGYTETDVREICPARTWRARS